MSAGHGAWLQLPLVFLGAAVVAVPLARWLRLGSILGYLVAGLVVGPVLGLVPESAAIAEVAELGVVLMLFLVGLELEPKRLWAMRRPIFGWGSVQLLGCAAALAAVGIALGYPWRLTVVVSLGLAMSSTAVALAVLAERNLGRTTAGESILSVALLQDIAAIPVLALVPVLAISGAPDDGDGQTWLAAAKAIGAIVVIIFGGRLLLRPALRWIAHSKTPEIFTAAALLLVLGTASLMQVAGLSMALGAFLAGVLLAESEYRRELETDLEPFKGLLLGLFFIAVGMGLDLKAVAAQPGFVAALLLALLSLKIVVLAVMSKLMKIPLVERPAFIILLAPGGEFGFVVFQLAQGNGMIDAAQNSALVAAVALSLALTPLLLTGGDRLMSQKLARRGLNKRAEAPPPPPSPIIIAGSGRYGQVVARMLRANGIEATVLDHDSEAIESLRRFGWTVYYGDATRLDMLKTAGAATARILVIAIDDIAQSIKLAEMAREHFPQLTVVARARNVQHYYQLHEAGVRHIERETFDAALMSARSVLELTGMEPHAARRQAMRFRRHNIEVLDRMVPLQGDEGALIAAARLGRQQFEELMAAEREAEDAHRKAQRGGWDRQDAGPT
ncbi:MULTISPECIES: glutathione-regulated potassium-efflux system protein KefC [unclassified Roseateles]|uniref:glutathione-regulated potassium-efflux system protein KefC n=1 Tax=unclassified Roseateles TaxID=2626991 RepID=UPI0006F7D7B3|nr:MULTISPECIES: glutathione-regulated potassium-efflux system protein KefC [unclassified Roseateles]KQW51917.1 potassium transporter [Pelomonas sp. Root405]KRA78150.1 potassium transporter [Pelomonas sp. Root662]